MSESVSPLLAEFRKGFDDYAAVFNAGDFERASRILSDDVEQHFPDAFPERMVRGRENWVRFFEEYRRDLGKWEMTLIDSFDAGPRQLIAAVEYVGVGRSSGLRTTFKSWDLVEFDEQGKVKLLRNCSDRDQATAVATARAAGEGG